MLRVIKELIDKITTETTIDEIIPELVEISTKEDELEKRITELEGDVLARDEEIKSLKESNFDLMKKIFDKAPTEPKDEYKEEIVTDEEIFDEIV